MFNIIYCCIFVGLLWLPFVWYHTEAHGFSPLHATITLFNAINALICVWEIALYRYADLIHDHYEKQLKPKYGQRLPPGFLLLDPAPLSRALTLKHWSAIWSTYALLDPAYADSKTFQFWVDVGNGHSFLIPSILFSFCVTFDIFESYMSPRNQGLIACMFQYVMMQGTFLYYASYLYSKKWVGCSLGGKCFVAAANALWVIFPSIAIYCSYHAVQDNSWEILRA
jgi:hypothetical protein